MSYPSSLQLQLQVQGVLQSGVVSSPSLALPVCVVDGRLQLGLDKSASTMLAPIKRLSLSKGC